LLPRSLCRGEEFVQRSERIALFVLERLDDLPLDCERTGDGLTRSPFRDGGVLRTAGLGLALELAGVVNIALLETSP
jgi:hypothetical protein